MPKLGPIYSFQNLMNWKSWQNLWFYVSNWSYLYTEWLPVSQKAKITWTSCKNSHACTSLWDFHDAAYFHKKSKIHLILEHFYNIFLSAYMFSKQISFKRNLMHKNKLIEKKMKKCKLKVGFYCILENMSMFQPNKRNSCTCNTESWCFPDF